LVQIRTFIVDDDLDKLGIVATLVPEHWATVHRPRRLVGVAALAVPEMLSRLTSSRHHPRLTSAPGHSFKG
jgi:hypothetical protein